MAALPYIQLYVADYLADTMHLTTEDHGAYLLLIFNYWQTGKAIPKKRLPSVTRMSNERWADVEDTLKEFFIETPTGEWFHPRIEADLEKVKGKSEQASAAGKVSARLRAEKKKEEQKQQDIDLEHSINGRSNGRSIPVERKSNHPDTDTDSDSDSDSEEEKTRKNLEACVPPTPKKRATRLPEDWAPTPDQIAWARSERKDINPATEASKFRDYWIAKAGRDASKMDWDATWRNWVRNAKAAQKATANGSEPEWLKGAR